MNRRDRHASIRRSPLATLMDKRQAVTATNIEIDKDAKPSARIPNRIHGAFRTMTNGQFHPLVDHRERELHCMRDDRLRFDQQNRSRPIPVVHRFLIHGSGVFLDGGHIVPTLPRQPSQNNDRPAHGRHDRIEEKIRLSGYASSGGLTGKVRGRHVAGHDGKRRNRNRRKPRRASVDPRRWLAPKTITNRKLTCGSQRRVARRGSSGILSVKGEVPVTQDKRDGAVDRAPHKRKKRPRSAFLSTHSPRLRRLSIRPPNRLSAATGKLLRMKKRPPPPDTAFPGRTTERCFSQVGPHAFVIRR
ncbi:hypothetical protein UA19_00182 [Burkholderia multivorans]|nr:hypothetical protein NP80_3165 [Burkholderia multivorans ATCC BAA-247]SAK11788.1 hypothetical protein UA21_00182 [Burkholderia multivorans]SAK11807.1 hypothetical protein UA19_00182 [Burkholderia multivorans]SPU79286.1 Uncharacterised protein [Burkholderia multivorans]